MTSRTASSLLLLLITASLASPAIGQEVSSDDIVEALTPRTTLTRSLRGVTVDRLEDAAPRIDLQVNFEFDSADLTNEALITLRTLGHALRDERLADFNFMIIGHTDAVGSAAYNQSLSERRAAAVREHLVFFYDLAPERITSVGKGETQLALPHDPENELNRRVEIRNISP
ncbi:MAG: OmpA family protein [Salinarimonadaceae bacterium]|nr:MAG: OmpA family protein [Salinarimonadaceae bacterium]